MLGGPTPCFGSKKAEGAFGYFQTHRVALFRNREGEGNGDWKMVSTGVGVGVGVFFVLLYFSIPPPPPGRVPPPRDVVSPSVCEYLSLVLFGLYFPRRKAPSLEEKDGGSWLLRPVRESNLQLFSLASIWISNKIHDRSPLSVKSLKALGDKLIIDQHFTTKDFVEAELVFMEVSGYDIGASNIAFNFLEDLLIQFRYYVGQ
ncbi:hypothetical protein ZIOFF_074981 [Zingiber officinale]|uniref:Cyclin N-terminal domain-containing protein n=1 Tax=Zingiber officinale TaxID=94328 RepID=A0A8J5C5D3_ZINOF|nr:hypothetical protein ZIOFF_074981 [Zingiber officinale]